MFESEIPIFKGSLISLELELLEERKVLEASLPFAPEDERAKINTRLVYIGLACDNIDRAWNMLSRQLQHLTSVSKPKPKHTVR